MTSADLTLIVKSVTPVVREFYAAQVASLKAEMEVQRAVFAKEIDAFSVLVADLEARVAAAESRVLVPGPMGPAGPEGPAGLNGKDGQDGRHGIDGVDGKNGIDGKDGRDGAPGEKGLDGKNGIDGKDGLQGEKGMDGRHGIDGKDGRDGLPGVPGRTGEKGIDGRDGIDGKHGLAGLNGKDGSPGRDGKDGKDGFGFDQADLTFDERKGFALKFTRGDRAQAFPIPIPFHAGTWEAGRSYPKGAMVTVRGSSFVALRETQARPDENDASARDWKLAVKRGKDGKDGKDGKSGDE